MRYARVNPSGVVTAVDSVFPDTKDPPVLSEGWRVVVLDRERVAERVPRKIDGTEDLLLDEDDQPIFDEREVVAAIAHPDADAVVTGATYDAQSDRFTPPAPQPVTRTVTLEEFALLFTQSERSAIRALRAAGDDLADGLNDAYELLGFAGRVVLMNETSTRLLDLLQDAGVISQGRADQITQGERP